MSWYNYYAFYQPAEPREVKGGIKAHSGQRTFGKSWWAKRWIRVLENFNIGARLGSGRAYARKGQVTSVEIRPGKVIAQVQGTRPHPYKVSIGVKTLSKTQWKKIASLLSRRAIFAAKLLTGEMPDNIEEAFTEAGLTLFPRRAGDLKTDCSCPDWSNPCKHIAAVYYLLGEEFDRDPFLIFKLRGMERKELMDLLSGQKSGKRRYSSLPETTRKDENGFSAPPPEPLSIEPEAFWGKADMSEAANYTARIPSTSAALPRRLGNFPFWRGEENFFAVLDKIYKAASPIGLDLFLGEKKLTDGE